MNRRPRVLYSTGAIKGFLQFKLAEGLSPATVFNYERDLKLWVEHMAGAFVVFTGQAQADVLQLGESCPQPVHARTLDAECPGRLPHGSPEIGAPGFFGGEIISAGFPQQAKQLSGDRHLAVTAAFAFETQQAVLPIHVPALKAGDLVLPQPAAQGDLSP